MSPRVRLLGLLGVVVLLVVALVGGSRDSASPEDDVPDQAAPEQVDLVPLRSAAALDPCPAGLGPELPDLTLPCLGGGDDVRVGSSPPGRPTLVNVWATWCGPCVREVPELVAFAEKAGDRVGVVGVLTQDTARNGLEFAREFGVHYPSVVDDDREILTPFASGPPVTLLLDAEGRIAHVERGELVSVQEIEALVAEHLGVTL